MTVRTEVSRARTRRLLTPAPRIHAMAPPEPLDARAYLRARQETILRHVHDAVFATDLENRITFWSESAERLFEYTSDVAEGRMFADLLPFQMAPGNSFEDLTHTVGAGGTWRGQGAVTCPSGRELWLESTVSPIFVDDGMVGSVSVSRDMTAQHAAEGALADRARILRTLAHYATAATGINDESRLAPALTEAMMAVIPADYIVLSLLDPVTGRYIIRAAHGAEGTVGAEILPNEGSAGRAIAARTLVVVDRLEASSYGPAVRAHIRDDAVTTAAMPLLHDGAVIGTITVARHWVAGGGFSEAEREALTLFAGHAALAVANTRLLAEVSELAVHDGLTGLYNRRHFDASLELLLARWRRDRDPTQPIAAIMFDLDRFGRLNRDRGHQAGDAVLRAFGGILHERLRSSDLVARYGGEEFIAILEGSSLADAVLLADLIRTTLEARRIEFPDGVVFSATVSAGVSVLDPGEPSAESLLKAADVGLFMAKRAGRNRVVAA